MRNNFKATLRYFKKINPFKLIGFIFSLILVFSMTFLLHLFDFDSAINYYNQVNGAVASSQSIFFSQLSSQFASATSSLSTDAKPLIDVSTIITPSSEQTKQFFVDFRNEIVNFNNFVQNRFNSLERLIEHSLLLSISIYVTYKLISYCAYQKENKKNSIRLICSSSNTTSTSYEHIDQGVFLTYCHLNC